MIGKGKRKLTLNAYRKKRNFQKTPEPIGKDENPLLNGFM
jgi:hypothetical protein